MTCPRCEEDAARQAEQMKPREIKEGLVVLAHIKGLKPCGNLPFPDIRLGDIIKVTLVAQAVEDMRFCECENE